MTTPDKKTGDMTALRSKPDRVPAFPNKIANLITRFDNNLEAYRSGKYNEAQLRQEFLNPLFISPNTHPAYQLRRYAWSAKLPLSILTDFEELAIYDCPAHYIKYNQYPDRLKGSFDKFAESGKRHKPEVDSEFLKEIESWRETLAKNIALGEKLEFTRRKTG